MGKLFKEIVTFGEMRDLMRKIRLVTDSTADLPQWFAEKYKVSVVPLHITFPDGRTFLDGVTVSPREYNQLLREIGDELPKTSTPTKEDFQKVYRLSWQRIPIAKSSLFIFLPA